MKIQGVLHELEMTTSTPSDNRVIFEIDTPIGMFTYDSEYYLAFKNIIEALTQFGIDPSEIMSLRQNDIRNIIFDIDITAKVRKGEE